MVSLQMFYWLLWRSIEGVKSVLAFSLMPYPERFCFPLLALATYLGKWLCLVPSTVNGRARPPQLSFLLFQERRACDQTEGVQSFEACFGGCFYLTHPPGLVFKPWPGGSGMMRTLFQSPPPPPPVGLAILSMSILQDLTRSISN